MEKNTENSECLDWQAQPWIEPNTSCQPVLSPELLATGGAVLKEVITILIPKASTADTERIFSSFGLVQSKLHNKLGMEKAAKLVFLFKMLNSNSVLQKYL